jgi:hypothetical protein
MRADMNKQTPVVIAEVSTESEASVIKSLLASYDVPCHYASGLPTRLYPFSKPDPGRIKIFVTPAFERKAGAILSEHRRQPSPLQLVEN